ncbi:hypothetical protein [uncultured Campylobacter sp.]|uniref:hypothetical protein n=1 Tax=uncultured Campylobacter sp. TaxID=218934 RepID=UPI002614ADD1|nr:hypothetical protein [uncultured Campylobacter sp.]
MARENFRILRHGEILKFHSLLCGLNSKNSRLNEIQKSPIYVKREQNSKILAEVKF